MIASRYQGWCGRGSPREVASLSLQREEQLPIDRADVAKFNQLCVHPTFQGSGLGSRLLDLVERRAAELGAAHVACDTSEDAHALIQRYERRGYVFVEHMDLRPRTNYRSVVLSLTLGSAESAR
jgi:GNAT superfamily N-acetyltransferase